MKVNFSSFEMYSIAEAEIPEMEISGSGGVVTPRLWMPLRLNVSHATMLRDEGLEIVSLDGDVSTIDGNVLLISEHDYIGFIMPKGYDGFRNQQRYLKFPLDLVRVAALEQIRAGGNLKLRLNARLIVHKLQALNPRPANQPLAHAIWGYVQPHQLHLQAEITIPRDAWISRVLNGVGYGQIHIVELPAVPLSACAYMDHAFRALQQAQERHKIGLYDEAVGKCRVALEKFFEHEDKTGDDNKTRRVPVLAKSWETKLGKNTYDWLNNSLAVLKEAANKSHHSPNAHYDQFDSQMIIAITTTLVAYAARHAGREN